MSWWSLNSFPLEIHLVEGVQVPFVGTKGTFHSLRSAVTAEFARDINGLVSEYLEDLYMVRREQTCASC